MNEPLNEAMKHQDIVSGFPQKRSIDEFPKALRPMVRWFAILLLLIFAASLIYTLWSYL